MQNPWHLEQRLSELSAVPLSHGTVRALLADYARPNDKIAEWLKQGVLISLKRGLYVVGEPWCRGDMPLPLVANRLYGPSCVSLDYALSWHGIIPERVHEVTSICMKRGRTFDNALGRFSYRSLPAMLYPVGVQQGQGVDGQHFVIAGPTKALCDKLLLTPHVAASGIRAMTAFLREDLRVDDDFLEKLDAAVIERYLAAGRKRALLRALASLQERGSWT